MLFRIVFSLIVCALFLPANSAMGQEELGALCDSWSRCNKEMTEKYKALNEGDVSPGLTEEYRDLVDEANNLIKAMRKQAIVELKERPGDGQIIRTMLGIMVHDAQEGRDGMVLDAGQALIESKVNPKYFEQAASIDRLELSQKHVFEELLVRHREAIEDDLPRVKLNTTAGEIVIELFENEAPNTVRNFVSLIESGYYSNKLFHRVIENFMAQGGGFETEGIGSGGPGYEIECECKAADARRNFTRTISMAHAGRDTGGSQFFLNFKYNKFLDQNHTVFGRIISGADVLDRIERTEISTSNGQEIPIKQAKPDKIVSAEVIRKRDHSYRVRKKGEPELPEEPEPKKEEPTEKEVDKEEPEVKKEPEAKGEEDDSEPEMKEGEKSSEEPASDEPAKEETEEPKAEEKEESSKEEPSKEEPSKEEGSGEGESAGDKPATESETPAAEEAEEAKETEEGGESDSDSDENGS